MLRGVQAGHRGFARGRSAGAAPPAQVGQRGEPTTTQVRHRQPMQMSWRIRTRPVVMSCSQGLVTSRRRNLIMGESCLPGWDSGGRPRCRGEQQRGRPGDDRSRPIGHRQPSGQTVGKPGVITPGRARNASGGVTYRALGRSPSLEPGRQSTIDAHWQLDEYRDEGR